MGSVVAQEAFDHVYPGRARRCEVDVKAGVRFHPALHLDVFVRGMVVRSPNFDIPNRIAFTPNSDGFPVHCRAVARTSGWLDSEASNPELPTLDVIPAHDRVTPRL